MLLISTVWGLRLGLLTALLSAAAFNWFHLPPLGALDIAADHDLVALVVFAIVAVASGTLAELARARAAESERRREEADRALAELAELARERDRMQAEAIEAEALRRSDELKTSLLRSVSHDLRTPLTSIIAAGAALDSPSVTAEERHELSEAVVEQGQRLSRLVENLLDVSRLESGNAEPHREPVDLAEAAGGRARLDRRPRRGGAAGARPRAAAAAAPTRPSSSAPSPTCSRTPSSTAAASRSWSARAWSGRGSSSASSTAGPGIPESERERIFEPFYRRPPAAAPATAPASAWRSPGASSRPTAARSRSSRCPARAAASSSASPLPARGSER